MQKQWFAIAGRALFMALILLFFAAYANAAGNGTTANMSAAINSTQNYLNNTNQSAYLVFYPNLAKAYDYLSLAKNESTINQSYAYSLLAQARESAQEQQNSINKYKSVSLYILVAISAILLVCLYSLMRPSLKKRQTNAKPSR